MSRRHCLILDDDRIAAAFMGDLVAAQGLMVDVARTLREADQRLSQQRYDILLIDRRLPDGDGVSWLSRVLANAVRGPIPRCLVTSGDLIEIALLPRGVGQLRKPLDAGQLCEWLEHDLTPAQGTELASPGAMSGWETADLFDDASALARFGGNRDAVRALRGMLLVELKDSAGWRQQLRESPPPHGAMDALHRLRAACALTGCARLGMVSEAVESPFRRGSPAPTQLLDGLDAIVAETIAAITGQRVG